MTIGAAVAVAVGIEGIGSLRDFVPVPQDVTIRVGVGGIGAIGFDLLEIGQTIEVEVPGSAQIRQVVDEVEFDEVGDAVPVGVDRAVGNEVLPVRLLGDGGKTGADLEPVCGAIAAVGAIVAGADRGEDLVDDVPVLEVQVPGSRDPDRVGHEGAVDQRPVHADFTGHPRAVRVGGAGVPGDADRLVGESGIGRDPAGRPATHRPVLFIGRRVGSIRVGVSRSSVVHGALEGTSRNSVHSSDSLRE